MVLGTCHVYLQHPVSIDIPEYVCFTSTLTYSYLDTPEPLCKDDVKFDVLAIIKSSIPTDVVNDAP